MVMVYTKLVIGANGGNIDKYRLSTSNKNEDVIHNSTATYKGRRYTRRRWSKLLSHFTLVLLDVLTNPAAYNALYYNLSLASYSVKTPLVTRG